VPSKSPSGDPPVTVCTDPVLLSSEQSQTIETELGIEKQSGNEVEFKFSLTKVSSGEAIVSVAVFFEEIGSCDVHHSVVAGSEFSYTAPCMAVNEYSTTVAFVDIFMYDELLVDKNDLAIPSACTNATLTEGQGVISKYKYILPCETSCESSGGSILSAAPSSAPTNFCDSQFRTQTMGKYVDTQSLLGYLLSLI
jgi:hypothetical protein